MISHRFNIVSKTVAVEDKTLTPVHGLRPYGLPSALKIMAGQWQMSGQNVILTAQKLHSPVMLRPVKQTLILEQTAKFSPVNLRFCLFEKYNHVH